MKYYHFHVLNDVLNAQPHFETYPDRSPVLRDQKVVLEVQNRPLLPRFFSAFQSSEMPLEIPSELHLGIPFEISPEMHLEMHFEIPPELHLDMHFEISTNNEIYGRSIWVCAAHRLELKDTPRRANKQQEETAIPSPTQNPTPNLLIKLQLGRIGTFGKPATHDHHNLPRRCAIKGCCEPALR